MAALREPAADRCLRLAPDVLAVLEEGEHAAPAGPGVAAWICSRIFSRTAVVLMVVKTLAVTTSFGLTPAPSAALKASSNCSRYCARSGSAAAWAAQFHG